MSVCVVYREFAEIWNASNGIAEVCNKTGQTKAAAATLASKMRKLGWDLKRMPYQQMRSLESRFWSFVRKTDNCWVWTGSTNGKGYGQMSQGKRGFKPLLSHRVSWKLHFGVIPEGLCVLHRCDNPPCVRPGHLFLGTMTDNDADRDAKGRTAKGSDHCRSKLTESVVVQAREMYWKKRVLVKDIAAQLGVISASALSQAVLGRTWKHVPMPSGIDASEPWSSGTRGAVISRIQRQIDDL